MLPKVHTLTSTCMLQRQRTQLRNRQTLEGVGLTAGGVSLVGMRYAVCWAAERYEGVAAFFSSSCT